MNKEVVQSLASRMLAMGCSLVTMVLASRLLGPEGKGRYSYLVTILGIGLQAGSLGLGTANLFHASRDRSVVGALAGNTLVVSLLASGALLLILIACTWLVPRVVPFDMSTSLVLGCALLAGLFWMAGQNILVGGGLVGWFNLLSVSYSLILTLAMAVTFTSHDGALSWMAIAQSLSYLLTGVAVVLVIRRRSPGGISINSALLRRTLVYGLGVYLAQVVTFVAMRVDLMVVQYRLSGADLGFYSLASDFCNVIVQVQAVLNLLLFTRLARCRTGKERLHTTRSMLLHSGGLLLVALLAAALILEWGVSMVFGPAFVPAARAVLALMPGTLFLVLASVLQNHIGAAGRPGLMAVGPCIAFVVSLVLNLLLVDSHGISGAAWASTLAYLSMFISASIIVLLIERSAMRRA